MAVRELAQPVMHTTYRPKDARGGRSGHAKADLGAVARSIKCMRRADQPIERRRPQLHQLPWGGEVTRRGGPGQGRVKKPDCSGETSRHGGKAEAMPSSVEKAQGQAVGVGVTKKERRGRGHPVTASTAVGSGGRRRGSVGKVGRRGAQRRRGARRCPRHIVGGRFARGRGARSGNAST